MIEKRIQKKDDSVSIALSELMQLENERQEEKETRIAKEIATNKAKEETRHREEQIRRKNKEIDFKKLEKTRKDEDSQRKAEAEAIKIKATKESEVKAQKAIMEHKATLAAIKAKVQLPPKWIVNLIILIILFSCFIGYTQYSNSEKEKTNILKEAKVQKLQFEIEKARREQQKEYETKNLEAQNIKKEQEIVSTKIELAKKNALLEDKINTIKSMNANKRRSYRVSTTKKKKQKTNWKSTDPLKRLSL